MVRGPSVPSMPPMHTRAKIASVTTSGVCELSQIPLRSPQRRGISPAEDDRGVDPVSQRGKHPAPILPSRVRFSRNPVQMTPSRNPAHPIITPCRRGRATPLASIGQFRATVPKAGISFKRHGGGHRPWLGGMLSHCGLPPFPLPSYSVVPARCIAILK